MSKYTEYVRSQSASEQLKADIYANITAQALKKRTLSTPFKAILSASAAVALAFAIVLPITLNNLQSGGGDTIRDQAVVKILSPGTSCEDAYGNSIGLDRLEVTRTVNYKDGDITTDGVFIIVYGTCDFTHGRQNAEKQYYIFENLSLTYSHVEEHDNDTQIQGEFVRHEINGKYSDGVFRRDLLENDNSDGTLKGEYALIFEIDGEGADLILGDITGERGEGRYEFDINLEALGFWTWSETDNYKSVRLIAAIVDIEDAIINL